MRGCAESRKLIANDADFSEARERGEDGWPRPSAALPTHVNAPGIQDGSDFKLTQGNQQLFASLIGTAQHALQNLFWNCESPANQHISP